MAEEEKCRICDIFVSFRNPFNGFSAGRFGDAGLVFTGSELCRDLGRIAASRSALAFLIPCLLGAGDFWLSDDIFAS